MDILTVNVGVAPNDGSGDPLRNAMIKVNTNFQTTKGAVESLDAQVAEAAADIVTLQSGLAAVAGEVLVLQGDVGDLQGNVTTLQSNVADLQTDVVALQDNVGDLQTDVGSLQTGLAAVADEVTTLQGVVAAQGTTIGELEDDVANLQEQIDDISVRKKAGVTFVKNGASLFLPTNDVTIPIEAAGEIDEVLVLAMGGTLTCRVDVRKSTYADYPTSASICGGDGNKPQLNTAAKSQNLTLTGWTKDLVAGDILTLVLENASGAASAFSCWVFYK